MTAIMRQRLTGTSDPTSNLPPFTCIIFGTDTFHERLPNRQPVCARFQHQAPERINDWMKRYVDAGKLPFAETLIARRGEIVFHQTIGHRDVENGLKAEPNGIHRIYSMTKPIVSAAIMQLLEDGRLQLDDPVAWHLPELSNLKVFEEDGVTTKVAKKQPTLHHLLTHTSGLTYGIFDPGPVGKAMRKAKIDFSENTPDLTRPSPSLPLSRWYLNLVQAGTMAFRPTCSDVWWKLPPVCPCPNFCMTGSSSHWGWKTPSSPYHRTSSIGSAPVTPKQSLMAYAG